MVRITRDEQTGPGGPWGHRQRPRAGEGVSMATDFRTLQSPFHHHVLGVHYAGHCALLWKYSPRIQWGEISPPLPNESALKRQLQVVGNWKDRAQILTVNAKSH